MAQKSESTLGAIESEPKAFPALSKAREKRPGDEVESERRKFSLLIDDPTKTDL